MIDLIYDLENRTAICIWIGNHIDAVNAALKTCLQTCHDCFHPWEQPTIQIFAAPLAQSLRIAGLCKLGTDSATLLIDVGRVIPEHWLTLVVHEYAHAHAGSPGHHQEFARSLTHLCLGLGIVPPANQPGMEVNLRFYPDCCSTQNPLGFWQGKEQDWQIRVSNHNLPLQSIE
jgi:hypothetical protein